MNIERLANAEFEYIAGHNKYLVSLQELESFAKALQSSEPVGEVVIHMIGTNDVCAIQWMDGYKPKVGDLLFAHPPATVPEGYALVPIEPTNEMLDALADTLTGENEGCSNVPYYKDAYKAMLSASPTPPNAVPLEKYNKLLEQRNDAIKALGDLSFECFAGIGLTQPSVKTYNETFKTLNRLRKAIAEAEGKV